MSEQQQEQASEPRKRLPCRTCPWRTSTPPHDFPGGWIDTAKLLRMAAGDFCEAMQCHSTPDGDRARACVGFALVVGFDSVGLRLAASAGRYDPEAMATDEPLHTVESVIATHGDCRRPRRVRRQPEASR